MSSMNLATQKRLGVLPKTEDTLSYGGHMYGNTHRGFRGRTPSPTSPGFFGLGAHMSGHDGANGDGKLHYYGNGEGQADLPMNGFYGFGSADLEYQAANMLIDGGSTHEPTNPPGMYGLPKTNQTFLGVVMLASGLWIGNNSKDGMTTVPALGLMGLGLYTFATNAGN